MAKAGDQKSRVAPPYGSFKSFRSFIDRLHKTVVPDVIDRSMMAHMSGVTQAETLCALRFLGLLGENDTTRDSLRTLVKAFGTKEWQSTLGRTVTASYKRITGDLNIRTATAKALSDRFRESANLDGYGLEKALRFYIAALKEAEIQYSPLFKFPRTTKSANRKATPKSKSKKTKTHDNGSSGDGTGVSTEGMVDFPLHFGDKPQGVIRVPASLGKEDMPVVNAMVAAVDAYASRNDNGEGG